jgi:hypothetical protein
MRLLLLAGSLAFALSAAAAADPQTAPETTAPSPAAATPPAPAAEPAASEAPKKTDPAPPAETKPKTDPKKPAQDARKLAATYFKQCVHDWDAATHMTKREWERTCRRVVDARMKFMLDQMGGR